MGLQVGLAHSVVHIPRALVQSGQLVEARRHHPRIFRVVAVSTRRGRDALLTTQFRGMVV